MLTLTRGRNGDKFPKQKKKKKEKKPFSVDRLLTLSNNFMAHLLRLQF